MGLTDILALLALVISFCAFLISIYQTKLTRVSLDIANESITRERITRQLDMLPRANFIIHVKISIEEWLADIGAIKEQIEVACEDTNNFALKEISEKSLNTPKGLVEKYYYQNSPDWLSEIYVSAARYYYSCVGPLNSLWDKEKEQGRFDLCDDLVDRLKESSYHLEELLLFMQNVIPNSYLEAPNSLSDDRFLSEE